MCRSDEASRHSHNTPRGIVRMRWSSRGSAGSSGVLRCAQDDREITSAPPRLTHHYNQGCPSFRDSRKLGTTDVDAMLVDTRRMRNREGHTTSVHPAYGTGKGTTSSRAVSARHRAMASAAGTHWMNPHLRPVILSKAKDPCNSPAPPNCTKQRHAKRVRLSQSLAYPPPENLGHPQR
jgi:hypothetical protein